MATQPQSFTLSVPDEAIADLRERLARTRYPDQAPGAPWAYGTDIGYLQQLVGYWRTTFDWRAEEARLNAFPQYKVPLCGIDLHFLHVPGKGPAPCPLLLLHGWPGSVFEASARLDLACSFAGNHRTFGTLLALNINIPEYLRGCCHVSRPRNSSEWRHPACPSRRCEPKTKIRRPQ